MPPKAKRLYYYHSLQVPPYVENIIKDLMKRANHISPNKVSLHKLLKALIISSKDLSDSELLKALKEVL